MDPTKTSMFEPCFTCKYLTLARWKNQQQLQPPGDGEIIFICAFQVLGKLMPTPPRSVLWSSEIVKVVPWIRVKVTLRYHTSFLFTDWSYKVNTHQRISMSLFASLAISLFFDLGDAPTTDMIYDHIWYFCTKDPMFLFKKTYWGYIHTLSWEQGISNLEWSESVTTQPGGCWNIRSIRNAGIGIRNLKWRGEASKETLQIMG